MKTMAQPLESFDGPRPGTVPTVLRGGMLLAAMYLAVFDPQWIALLPGLPRVADPHPADAIVVTRDRGDAVYHESIYGPLVGGADSRLLLAGAEGMRTVAEFGNSDDSRATPRAIGFDYVQGCAVGKPRPSPILPNAASIRYP